MTNSPHDRTLDHYGVEYANTGILSTAVGIYPAGTDIETVLRDMAARLSFIEGTNSTKVYHLLSNAVLKKTTTSSFSADAIITSPIRGFTASAVIVGSTPVPGQWRLTANAYLIEPTNV